MPCEDGGKKKQIKAMILNLKDRNPFSVNVGDIHGNSYYLVPPIFSPTKMY